MPKDFGRGRFDREMHDAICSECGQPCQVPFKPTDGRPVYCKECYRKKKPRRW
jgi:CxxC-x17-CxxC domain-containing protein